MRQAERASNTSIWRMRVVISTHLSYPPERVWKEVQKPQLLQYVSAPILVFKPLDPPTFPEQWVEGRYQVVMHLFGFLPVGTQWIGIELPPASPLLGHFTLRDNGYGQLISVWDHRITIEPEGEGTCYIDCVDIGAGWLTPLVGVFASLFYRHRQRRWHKLVRNNMQYI